MNISLTAELQEFVEERVKSGLYQSASEVMREALRMFVAAYDRGAIADINRKIEEAYESVAAGRVYSPEESKAHLAKQREKYPRGRKS